MSSSITNQSSADTPMESSPSSSQSASQNNASQSASQSASLNTIQSSNIQSACQSSNLNPAVETKSSSINEQKNIINNNLAEQMAIRERNSVRRNITQTQELINEARTAAQVLHSVQAFRRIQDLFNEQKLCDVKLLCNNRQIEINAHKIVLSSVSDYFYAMFNNDLLESTKNEIEMSDMDGEALVTLVNFIYTGKIDLTDVNVFTILNAANFLQLSAVIKQGCDYLSAGLNLANCLSIYRFAEEQSLAPLKISSYKFLIDNFEKLANNDETLNEFNEQELEAMFGDEFLNVPNEEYVYEIMLKWISLNDTVRLRLLSRLLAKIKLPLLKASYLTKEIENNTLLLNKECQSLMLEAAIFHLTPEKFSTCPNTRIVPRKSTIGYLMCVGGVDHLRSNTNASFIEKYDSRLDKWTSMSTSINNMFSSLNSSSSSLSSSMNSNSGSNMPSHNLIKRVQFGVALLNSDFLYIVGGRDGLKTLNNVDRFDIKKESWSPISLMLTHRHGLQAAFLDNEAILYAVGGHDGWSFLNSVERFDLESKSWNYVASMASARSTHGIVNLKNILYVVGGRDANVCLNSVECYNPLTNKWLPCAPMYKRRGAVAVTSLNGFIYAVGGHEATSTMVASVRYDCGERYDTKLDQWTMIKSFAKAREAISVSNLSSSCIYIAGGYDGHKFLSDCEKYDPIKNEWTKIQNLNTPRASACLIYVPSLNDQKKFITLKSQSPPPKLHNQSSEDEQAQASSSKNATLKQETTS